MHLVTSQGRPRAAAPLRQREQPRERRPIQTSDRERSIDGRRSIHGVRVGPGKEALPGESYGLEVQR